VAELLSKLSQLRGHGPGAGPWFFNPGPAPSTEKPARKRVEHPAEAYPQPDRLRHPMSQARFGAGMERPAPRRPSLRGAFTSPPGKPAFTGSPQGPHHAPPRERERDPPRPRCLPSIEHPKRVGSSAQPAVSSLDKPLNPAPFLSHVLPARQRRERPGIGRTGGYLPKVIIPPILLP
jgi:hypothetical protein